MTTQDEVFSLYATQSLYMHGNAYSHRRGVNVLIGARTYLYGRPSHGVHAAEHVRACVTDAARRYSDVRADGGYDPDKGWEITCGPTHERGEYRFSVWAPKRP